MDPVVQDLSGDIENLMEMESLCLKCYEQGTTRMMLTRIPFFKEVIISSFRCENCHHHDTSIQPGGVIQEKGVKYILKVANKKSLNRTIIKSDFAVISIPELDFEQPSSRKGEINTVEGILDSIESGLLMLQEERRKVNSEMASKIDDFIARLGKLKSLEKPFTMLLDDPSGNSFMENLNAPSIDEDLQDFHYIRTHEQDILVGCCGEDEDPPTDGDIDVIESKAESGSIKCPQEEKAEPNWNFQEEVMSFQINCPSCHVACSTNMKLVDIPFFKQMVIMATVCDACGHRDNEVKGGSGIEPMGRKITLLIKNQQDLNRDVLKSDTGGIKIPELDFEMVEGSLGGRFTTVEGLLTQIKEQLSGKNPFLSGDSSQDDTRNRILSFCEKLDQIILGVTTDIHLVLDDPAGNSYIQNLNAPHTDPQLTLEDYERSFEQNEELGLNDMKTDNYTNDL